MEKNEFIVTIKSLLNNFNKMKDIYYIQRFILNKEYQLFFALYPSKSVLNGNLRIVQLVPSDNLNKPKKKYPSWGYINIDDKWDNDKIYKVNKLYRFLKGNNLIDKFFDILNDLLFTII